MAEVIIITPFGQYIKQGYTPAPAPQLDTPTNLSVTNTTASFDEVENAEKYEFFVDDVSIGEYRVISYEQVGDILTILNAPYEQTGEALTIG